MGLENIVATVQKPNGIFSIRHLQSTMFCLALLISFCTKSCMNIAVVAMTDPDRDNTFDWTLQQQSWLLSAHKYGYICVLLPAGELAAKFGARLTLTLCIAMTAIFDFLLPLTAWTGGWLAVFVCRIMQGAAQGLLYPSVHNMMAKWIPKHEKSRVGAIVYATGALGSGLQLIVGAFVADIWGWPAIFYVIGTAAAVWTVVYIFIGATCPDESKLISDEEKLYIHTSLEEVAGPKEKLKTPWRAMLTSPATLAIIIATCGYNFCSWTLQSELPTYIKRVFGVNIKKNGLLSSLPYFSAYILSFPFGFICDYVYMKGWLSITACRKWSSSIAMFGPALCLLGICFSPVSTVVISITFFTIGKGLSAAHYTGYHISHLDIAPNFAGTLIGISTAVANVCSVNAPIVAAAIIQDESNPSEWHKVFYLSVAVYSFAGIFYLIFGSGKVQPWNDPDFSAKGEKLKDIQA